MSSPLKNKKNCLYLDVDVSLPDGFLIAVNRQNFQLGKCGGDCNAEEKSSVRPKLS
jgi:hypothetical protein